MSVRPIRDPFRPSPRSAVWYLILGLLGVGSGVPAATAQVRASLPDLTLATAELEIHYVRSTSELSYSGTDLQVMVGVRNNGKGLGAFDYALGPTDRKFVYMKAKGTTLGAGAKHANAFRVPYKTVLEASGGGKPNSLVEVCYGLYLVKGGTETGWADANNPNHQKNVCTKVRIPPS